MLSDQHILDLAERATKGEREALGRLAGALRPLICRWALAMTGDPNDAEDVAQQVLMNMIGVHGGIRWPFQGYELGVPDYEERQPGPPTPKEAGAATGRQGGAAGPGGGTPAGRSAGRHRDGENERIARDARNMNEVLSAMASEVSERVPTPIHGRTAPARRGSFSRWRTLAPLAAAAIAALVLVRGGEMAREGEPFIPPPESRVPSMVSEMDVEADRPFAVLPTSDPDIAVVWLFYPQESD